VESKEWKFEGFFSPLFTLHSRLPLLIRYFKPHLCVKIVKSESFSAGEFFLSQVQNRVINQATRRKFVMLKSFWLFSFILLLSIQCFSQLEPYPGKFKPTNCDKNSESNVLIDCYGQALIEDKNAFLEKSFTSDMGTHYLPSNEALWKLSQINDVRVVPYLVQHLRYCLSQNAYSDVIKTLIKFDTEEAVQVLEEALNSSNNYLRRNLAQFIFESKNSKAWNILTKFYKDKDSSIRGRAVDTLCMIYTDKSTTTLREMLNDDEDWIRKKAQNELDYRDEALRRLNEIENN
jgi:HEAT repeats